MYARQQWAKLGSGAYPKLPLGIVLHGQVYAPGGCFSTRGYS